MTITRMIDNKEQLIVLTDEELRQASEQYDTSCRTEDILGKIKEKLAESFESLEWFGLNGEITAKIVLEDGNKAQDTAESMVWSVEHTIGHNDAYWDCFWSSVQYVIDEELCGIGYEENQMTAEYRDGHVYVFADGKTAADITPEEVKIFDFDLFADSENRSIISKKLAALDVGKAVAE